MSMTRFNLPQFPASGIRFLKNLKRNNRRDWFLQHKNAYEDFVRQPMVDLINALASEFCKFAPEIVANPKVSLYRIYRDTRFSKDKTPYKTHVAASFPLRGVEKHEGAGFYLHITASEFLIGGGLYSPQPEDLTAVRHHIAANHAVLRSIVNERKFREIFSVLSGEQLVRVPRGFPADHAAADLLKRKQYLASRLLPAEVVTTPKFGGIILESFRALHPLIRFLNEPILRNRTARQRRTALLSVD